MKVHWIIENITKEPSFLELSQAAHALGYPVHDIRGDFAREDVAHYQNERVVFNGSIDMCRLVGEQLASQGTGLWFSARGKSFSARGTMARFPDICSMITMS